MGSVRLFFYELICLFNKVIKLIKSDRRYFYGVTKDILFQINSVLLTFIHQRILKKMNHDIHKILNSTIVSTFIIRNVS